ncbi:unnamed protein product [Victoria cruziana]
MPSAVATAIDLKSLPTEVAALIERLQQQAAVDAQELARRGGELTLAQAKIDKLNFELARLRRWQFEAKTEAMTAAQRLLFAEALAEDEASLRAKLAELQRGLPEAPKTPKAPRAKPRRQALPAHLERVEHRHEPEDTHCPNADCRQPMLRIGGDVSEKLDIIPAKFFVHRHIYGKWACRVLHADETPVPLLDPGAGKTKKAYVWAWARSHHDPHPGVIYEFCLGRGSQYPLAFLGGNGPPGREPAWQGTLITDQYGGYNAVLDAKRYPQRKSAACAAHARRRFEELSRGGSTGHSASAVATEAMQRWARIYRAERAFSPPGGEPAVVGGVRGVAAAAAHAGAGRQQDRRGDRLQPQRLGLADAAPGRRGRGHRQQPHRAADQALEARGEELAVRRQRLGRPACGGGDEPGAVSQAQRPGFVGLPA